MAEPHYQFARNDVKLDGFSEKFLTSLDALSRDMEAQGLGALKVTSGFRTNEEQKVLYDRAKAGGSKYPAAAPGKSRHNHAGALDADSSQLNAAAKAGLLDKHGFHRPVKGDPVHLELMGAQKPTSTQQAQPKQQAQPMANDLTQAGNAAIDRTNVTAAALDGILAQQQSLIKSATASLQGSKDDAALVVQTKALAESQAQQQTLAFAGDAGTDPGAANFALRRLLDENTALMQQKRAVTDRIVNANTPRNMFDSPARWLADHLLQPYNEKKEAALSKQLDATQKQISFLNDATQSFARTSNAIAQTQTAETAAAQANLAKANIDVEVAKLNAEALKSNASMLTATTNMRNNEFDIRSRLSTQALQEEQLAASREQRAAMAEMRQLQLKDKINADATKQSILADYRLGATNTGTLQFDSFEALETHMKLDPEFRKTAVVNINNGMSQRQGGQATIGASPVEAVQFVTSNNAKLDPGRSLLVQRIQHEFADMRNSVDPNVQAGLKDRSTRDATANQFVLNKAGQHLADVSANSQTNWYAPPPMSSLLADPNVAKTYFGSTILKPLADSGAKEVPFTRAIDLLIGDVKAGKIAPEVAQQELMFFGTKIKLMNNDLYRYNATAGVPNMDTVKVPVNVPKTLGFFDSARAFIPGSGVELTERKRIDISDPLVLSALFNKVAASNVKPPVTTDKLGSGGATVSGKVGGV